MTDEELSDWLIEQSMLSQRSPDFRPALSFPATCAQCDHSRHSRWRCNCGCPTPVIPIFD